MPSADTAIDAPDDRTAPLRDRCCTGCGHLLRGEIRELDRGADLQCIHWLAHGCRNCRKFMCFLRPLKEIHKSLSCSQT